ncbi:MAG: sulfurtransferase, partial [Gammaproteobacteria bacterium]|nr:sulfurtransferase [Gammaproteobacteria bacterium]
LDLDLAAPRTDTSGRHPLPTADQLSELFGSWGLTPDKQLIAYDNAGGAVAARLWWLARWAGHEQVALLDGGLQAWEQSGGPLSTARPSNGTGRYPVQPGQLPEMPVHAVEGGVSAGELTLIDARDPVRFAGGAEPIDPVAGHVPGALNRPFNLNLDEQGRFKSPAALAAEFAALLDGQPEPVVSMCGSGVTACHNLFAMTLAGLSPAALYVGSWSEWIRDPARPVGRS